MATGYTGGSPGSSSTPVALMDAGTAMNIFGTYQANMDKASAEIQNADYYSQEAKYARMASMRQAMLTSQKYTYELSLQGSAAAKGGVDFSGSIANTLAQTTANQIDELKAVKQKGDMDVELAQSRAMRAQQQGDTLGSDQYNEMQAGKSILTLAMLLA